jgi:hypothetical protein
VASGLIEFQEESTLMQEALSSRAYAGPANEPRRAALLFEFAVVGFAMLGLVAAELMLSSAIRGTNFAGGDGKMAQAIILAAYKFGGFFHFNNTNPLQGLGSQLLPINVWINPTYWPFAILDTALANNASAAIALGIFALACYVMARCFDVPIVPSAIAAQLSIVLFAPMLFLLKLSTVFTLMVGNAVVYAPYMIALGLFARLEPGSWRRFAVITAGIFGLLFYSVCCEPLWSIVCCLSWALPFAIVALSPMRLNAVLVRCAALVCCLILLGLSGAAEYLFTLVEYIVRVQLPGIGDRVRLPDFQASALFYSPYMKYFYVAWASGWLLGLWTLRGRARVLVIAGIASCAALLAEILVYLLLQNASWSFPMPVYTEQGLFPLFVVSGTAGYWGALRAAVLWARNARGWPAILHRPNGANAAFSVWLTKAVAAFAVVAVLPVVVVNYAINGAAYIADLYNEPWPNEPELAQFLADNISQSVGRPFRGAVLFYFHDYDIHLTVDNLWIRSVPTILQYGQLVTAQSAYFNAVVLKNDLRGSLNGFLPLVSPSPEVFSSVLPMLGTRYYVVGDHQSPDANHLISLANQTGKALASQSGHSVVTLPQGAHHNVGPDARWRVYELPHPNLGDYGPTIAMTAETGAVAAAMMTQPDFDFTRKAVLSSTIDQPLVPARQMLMSLVRGGLHVSGHSDGTSLVVLPQQFSHCLRARDGSVRLVRANLMVTGVIFSGEIDTDVIFDYGLFTPRCRWADISDIKKLKMQIDARAASLPDRAPSLLDEGLFPNWEASMAKLGAAVSAIK